MSTSSSPSAPFLEAVQQRRSVYGLTDSSPIPDEKIVEIVKTAVTHAPSSFNVQSGRAVVVFGEVHRKVIDIAVEVFRENVPSKADWVASYRPAHGCVCYMLGFCALLPMSCCLLYNG